MSTTTETSTKPMFRINWEEFERQVALGESGAEGVTTLMPIGYCDTDNIDRLLSEAIDTGVVIPDEDRTIRVVPISADHVNDMVVIVTTYVDWRACHAVASMVHTLEDLAPQDYWQNDDDRARTKVVLGKLVEIANTANDQVMGARAALELRIRRAAPGTWRVTNHLDTEEPGGPLVKEFNFDWEAAAECEALIVQIESDRSVEDKAQGIFDESSVIDRSVEAAKRLDRFLRGEKPGWQLDEVDGEPGVVLEYIEDPETGR